MRWAAVFVLPEGERPRLGGPADFVEQEEPVQNRRFRLAAFRDCVLGVRDDASRTISLCRAC